MKLCKNDQSQSQSFCSSVEISLRNENSIKNLLLLILTKIQLFTKMDF